jgi:ABC-type uncharacterized transport system auxiliary subunit
MVCRCLSRMRHRKGLPGELLGEFFLMTIGWTQRSVGSICRRKWLTAGTITGIFATLVLSAGCAAMFARPAPSSLYQLNHQSQVAGCPSSFPASVRVWPLEASPPYDQESMVVLADEARVRHSSQYSWVAQPGRIVSEWLLRDLSQASMFPSVMTSGESFTNSYDLGGHLFAFAWQRRQEQWQALLDVEITLVSNRPGQSRQILMRKSYRLVSEPVVEHGPESFARAMSKVMTAFSTALQQDLCALSSQPHGLSAGAAVP